MLSIAFLVVCVTASSALELEPAFGVKFTTPQRFCASISAFIKTGQGPDIVLQLEPGLSGQKIHLGIGQFRSTDVPHGGAFKLSYLYNGDSPARGRAKQGYFGMEFEIMAVITLSGGIYVPDSGDDRWVRTMLTGGIGIAI